MREFYVLLNFILAIIMLNMNIKKIKGELRVWSNEASSKNI